MKKSRVEWTVQRFNQEVKKGNVSFDYPIQRAGNQWDLLQKSLLIHSVACDYPVPPLYVLAQEGIVGEGEKAKRKIIYYLLDGKQRTSNISEFMEDGFRLDENTPPFIIDDKEYDFSEHLFSELTESAQQSIREFLFDIYKIEEATDDQIEDMFFRLNNGTPLTQVQKAKAKMGSKTALHMKKLVEHPLMVDNAVFTTLQIRKADNEVALLQSMMLLDEDYTVGKFGNVEVSAYASSLRDTKEELFEKMDKVMTYLSDTLGDNEEKVLLKKLHMPAIILASKIAYESGLPTDKFAEWLISFKEKINSKENGVFLNGMPNPNVWLYKEGCGAGATKAEKVAERVHATKVDIEEFIKNVTDGGSIQEPTQEPVQEPTQEVVEAVQETVEPVQEAVQEVSQEVVEPTQEVKEEKTKRKANKKQDATAKQEAEVVEA